MTKAALKFTSLILTGLLAAASFAGCTKGNVPSESTTVSTSATTATSTAAPVEENASVYPLKGNVKLTYWMPMHANWTSYAKNFGELPIAQEIDKRTGVEIEYIHPPLGQDRDVFNLMIASGEYPDIIQYRWTLLSGGVASIINNGIGIKLNEVIDKYSPNLKKFLTEHPEYEKETKIDDGSQYFYPFVRDGKELLSSAGPIIRKDWLDDLGLPLPETVDDWYAMLKAFKEQKGAEAPLTVVSDKNSTNAFSIFEGAYGLYNSPGSFFRKDGKIYYGFMEPAYKDELAFIIKLFQEGLLDKNFAATDAKTRDSNMLNGKSGATFGTGGGNMGSWLATMKDKDPKFDLTAAKFPSLNKGERVIAGYSSTYMERNTQIVISTACKNVEAAARFLDYGYSEEGHMLYNFGIEGVSYNMVNGVPTYTDEVMNNPEKLTIAQAMSKYCCAPISGPFVQDVQYLMQYYQLPQQKEALKLWSDNDKVDSMLPFITLTAEESSTDSVVFNDIQTYIKEMQYKFILGQVPLSDFDKYVEQLKKMNIQECIDRRQAAMERFNKR